MKSKTTFLLLLITSSWISITPFVQSTTLSKYPETTPQHSNLTTEILFARPPICPKNKTCYPPPRSPNQIQILSPIEGSFLFNDSPSTISWSDVPNATRYSVSIEHAGEIIWDTIVTNATEIPYPSDVSLDEGKDYKLTVRTNSNQVFGNVTFRRLSQEETQQIQAEVNLINNNPNLSESEKALNIANLYSRNSLFYGAINTLLNANEEQHSVILSEQIGDLYWNVEQPILAKPYYEKALRLAINSDNLNQQADAKVGLGLVNMAQSNWEESIQWLQEARTHYQALNQLNLATEIARLLAEVYEKSGDRTQSLYWSEKAKIESENLDAIEK